MPQSASQPTSSDAVRRILLITDDIAESERIDHLLGASASTQFEVSCADSVEVGLQRLREGGFSAVLLDLCLEETQGTDTLAPAHVAATTVPFVVLSDELDERLSVRAHRFGAQDYLVKSQCDTALLVRTLRHAMERHNILRDLALSRQHEHYLATHDSLTGLPNRLALLEALHRSIAVAARTQGKVALLFLDLDRFKNINDSLGHSTGDELLRIFSRRLSEMSRQSDMVARLGGDEFVIMLQGVKHESDPARVAAKITELMIQPFVLGPHEYHVTTCIGIAVYPEDGIDTETLMRNADTAMYHAKHAGPNRYSYFSQNLNETVMKRLDIENGLQKAVANNSLEIHFQPLIDTVLGVPIGAEALLRWRHAERGMVPPSEFIPYAEESGLMTLIGNWVLRAACEQAAQWSQPYGDKLRVNVNISTKQLCDDGFPEMVMRILRETGLDPVQLELEITEHSVLQEVGATLCAVRSLRARGVRIVIDDFGTGYSALNALRSLPIDGIKIDRCFVRDIVTDPADATITRGLVAIAIGLGLEVTAEGIEDREQLAMLHEFGVQHMQGYLFAKPMAADVFVEMLVRGADAWLQAIIDP